MKTETETRFERHAPFGPAFDVPAGAYWAAAGLTTITGGIQLYHYWTTGLAFSLAIGALVLVAVVAGLTTARRSTLYALGIPFLVGQLFAWTMQGMAISSIYLADKSIQVLLIGLLAYLLWSEKETSTQLSNTVPTYRGG